MAVAAPVIDSRTYQELLDEALARIPVHNPEWTNFNRSDPGVTLIELFAFLTESLVYRANQIPERNRRKFLSLLGVPLAPASSARGIVVLSNEKGPNDTITLNDGIEALAGPVPFRTEAGLDVLPIEGRAYFKRPVVNAPPEIRGYYERLYASYTGPHPSVDDVKLYEAVPLDAQGPAGVSLQSTVDGSLWIALLVRTADSPPEDHLAHIREQLAGRTLNLGIVPVLADPRARLAPGGRAATVPARLDFQLPSLPPGGVLPLDPGKRGAQYRSLEASWSGDPLSEPSIVQVALPSDPAALALWANLDPLESGVGEFPPPLDDTKLADRVVTWLRIKAPPGAQAGLLWAGINATSVAQRAHVGAEVLPDGSGEPDQAVRLSRPPVIPDSIALTVGGVPWQLIDDLMAAGPEVPARDPRQAPGMPQSKPGPTDVFTLDAATGVVRFGDGLRGRRPPAGAKLRASYAYGAGAAGNVAADQITSAPALPAGLKVTNPVRTWGGAEAESVAEGEKQASRYLQHRDRLVSAADFESITWRTPGVDLGRVDVLPTFSPQLAPSAPGDAAGAVTLMLVPRYDAAHPDAPEPDQIFLDTVCDWLDPRRLVTTEVFLRGPSYVDVWLSVGIEVDAGRPVAVVREAVRSELRRFLAPVDPEAPPWFEETPLSLDQPYVHRERGWPLGKPVVRLELVAIATRVPGVRLVNGLELASGTGGETDSVDLRGLQLPRIRGISVVAGPPVALDQLRGQAPSESPAPSSSVPVPLIPENC